MTTPWPERSLGDICIFNYGKALLTSNRSGSGFPVYGSNGEVGRHTKALTDGPTIVVGRKGSFGKVHYSESPCWPIDTTYYIDAKSTCADLRWLQYRLRSLGLTGLNRAAAVPGLNRDDAYRQRLLVPPIEEQRRIAAVLDQAHEVLAGRRASLALVDSLTESIFFDMFGDPRVDVPADPLTPLIDLIDRDRPICYGILMPGPDVPEGVPYVRVVDMRGGGIHAPGVRRTTTEISNQFRRSLLRAGDVVISIRGHVGRVAEVPPELDGANITQDSARLAVKGVEASYLLSYLRTPFAQQWMAQYVRGVAVRGLNLGELKRLPVLVPPPRDQVLFAHRIRQIDGHAARVKESLAQLGALISSLQQRAFSGAL